MEKLTKNDKAWNKIFKELNILEHLENNETFHISSKTINQHREARLMTKFDHKRDKPKIFKENKLSILPITRGTYVIGAFETHQELLYDLEQPVIVKSLPDIITSISPDNITSESIALNAAFLSGMIDDFLEEKVHLTIDGRMSSREFSFTIDNMKFKSQTPINVKNAQIEIDGGYEGKNIIALFEAKSHLPEDFLIRQLFYPFLSWHNKENIKKKIIPIFMVYVDNLFTFFKFDIQDPYNYNSIKLIKQQSYKLATHDIITRDFIEDLIEHYEKNPNFQTEKVILNNKTTPYPQADNILRIIDLLKELYFINKNTYDKNDSDYNIKHPKRTDIAEFYGMTERQGSYYAAALIYLGLAKPIEDYRIDYTSKGKSLAKATPSHRQKGIIESIIQKPIMRKHLKYLLQNKKHLTQKESFYLMDKYLSLGDTTKKRRLQTIYSWVNWIYNQIQ